MTLAEQREIRLYQGHATPTTITLRALPSGDAQVTTIVLRALDAVPTTIVLRDVTAIPSGSFPTQYLGLKAYYGGAVRDLCLVAVADAPTGMGGQLFVRKGATTYAVYLVETSDPEASPMRIRTSTGTKSIRRKT